MTEVIFKDYDFKPEEVIEGLNKYYKNKAEGKQSYVRILDKSTVYHILNFHITEAINWLRDEHDIFYTPGMKLEDPVDLDIFDNPRYKFLSELSSELGFRSIVGPGNAEKTEKDILRVIKSRNERAKKDADDRREFLRKLGCELGVLYPIVRPGTEEKVETDILERIGELKEGNWPCENGTTFAAYMRKQFPKECEKWNVAPLQEGSVHDWVQYIFGVLDEWRKRAAKAEEELDRAWSHCGKLKGMLNTMYGASCGTAIHETLAKDALAELRAKIREVYRGVFSCGMEDHYSYVVALDDILKDYSFVKQLKEKAEEKAVGYKIELQHCREDILKVYREIFDCSDGDPEGSDKETLNDILEEYKRVVHNFEERTADWYQAKNSLSNLKRQYEDEKKLVSSVRAERDSNKAKYLVFLDELAKVLSVSYSNPNYIPAKEQDILRAVETLKTAFDAASEELEDLTVKLNDNTLYKSAVKLLGEYLTEAKDILGIDSCEKDAVAKAIKDLKSAYNNLHNDYDEVCEGYAKLKKDYDELGEAYSSVLKWNNSYADVRRLLEVPADADAGEMVGALNKLVCDYEKLQKDYEKAKCNTNYFIEFEKGCSERQAFIFKLCEALDVDKDSIGSFFDDEEAAILKAIDELHEATASIDQLRQTWHSRYKSEHERANGEHKRAEKCFGEIAALKTQVASLERSLTAAANEQVGLDAFRNECRKLREEKDKVIKALGQDIWDDCVK